MNPEDYKFSEGYAWVRAENGEAAVGLSDHAQQRLGSILFVELKEPGDQVTQGEPCGSIESDKAASDILCPVSGEVVAINEEMLDAPEMVNDDPYGGGWLLRVRLTEPQELDGLMSASDFEAFIAASA